MASPFSIFRKHQKSLMVVLVIGSMIAFTGESLFTSGGESWTLLGVLLGTSIAGIVGFQFGRPMPYAIGGAIIGGLIGFAGPSVVGSGGLQSRLGAFDEKRLGDLIAKRSAASSFINETRRRAFGGLDPRMLGMGGDPFQLAYSNVQVDSILGEVLRAEADEMGIYIDDDAVDEFVKSSTLQQLKKEDFIAVRKLVTIAGKPISEKQLYDLLRDQIKAKIALTTLAPYSNNDATPDVYWDFYRRMTVRQQVAFAPVPVDSFLDTVGEPSDADVQALFEKYKDKTPNLEPGAPGFYQFQRIKLAYVEADYGTVAAGIADATDAEIEKYYEDNKDRFKKAVVPEDPTEDIDDLPSLEEMEAEKEKAEAGDPADPVDPVDGEPKPEEKAEENAEESGSEKPESDDGKEEEEEGGCEPIQEETEEATQTEAAPPTADGSTDETQQPAGGLQAPTLGVPDAPQTDDNPFEDLPPEYIPLDAALKLQIGETLKQQKIDAELAKRIEAGMDEMKRLADLRDDREQAEVNGVPLANPMSDGDICKALKKFADANGLAYAETPLAFGRDLLDRQEYPIGSAVPPRSDFSQGQLNVVQTLFGGQGSAPVFTPARAELSAFEFDGSVNQFAYWATAQVDEHEPKDLDEPGLREQVVKAWKRQQAAPKALARAEAIAKQVTGLLSEEMTMSKILKDTTETGTDSTAKLVVTESLPFSWIRSSSAPSPQRQQPQVSLTQIDGIVGITNDFMETIFTKLAPNEVGVAKNGNSSIYYVVQPLNRFPTDDADKEAARERFLGEKHFEQTSPMPQLVQDQYGQLNRDWLRSLQTKYDVDLGF